MQPHVMQKILSLLKETEEPEDEMHGEGDEEPASASKPVRKAGTVEEPTPPVVMAKKMEDADRAKMEQHQQKEQKEAAAGMAPSGHRPVAHTGAAPAVMLHEEAAATQAQTTQMHEQKAHAHKAHTHKHHAHSHHGHK